MTKCDYCNQPISAPALYLEQNKVYHTMCYVQHVQETACRVQQITDKIIASTQGSNAAANSQARRLWAVMETLKR